jgi:hypothetical protein
MIINLHINLKIILKNTYKKKLIKKTFFLKKKQVLLGLAS